MIEPTPTPSSTPSPSPASPPTPSAPAPDGGSSPTPQTAARPDWLPEAHWDATAGSIRPEFGQHYSELTALKTEHDARLAARPEKPEGYAFELPKDFEVPKEFPLTLDDKDPELAAWRSYAHELGLSQEQFAKALTLRATAVIEKAKATKALIDGETAKLGARASDRTTAVKTWLTSVIGKQATDSFMQGMVLAADIEALEKVQTAFSSQGGAPFNGGGREHDPPPPPTTIEDRWYGGGQQKKAS